MTYKAKYMLVLRNCADRKVPAVEDTRQRGRLSEEGQLTR